MTKEQHKIQPAALLPAHGVNSESIRHPLEISSSPMHAHLQHQSKSFPPRLQRTPSVSSQSSLDSAQSRQSVSISSTNFVNRSFKNLNSPALIINRKNM